MNYHNLMIEVIAKNVGNLELALEMSDINVQTEMNFHRGDIDVLATGICWYTNKHTQAIIEAKGHFGLISHYKRCQLPKYKEQFPNARQYVCYGKEKSLKFEDFSFLGEEDLS